jgi:hypothetical protein
MDATSSQYVENALRGAIQSMRDFLDRAERVVNSARDKGTAAEWECAAGQVLHQLAWGVANASTGVEEAIAGISRYREMEVEKAKQDAPGTTPGRGAATTAE